MLVPNPKDLIELVREAMARPQSEREPLLRDRCGGDPDLFELAMAAVRAQGVLTLARESSQPEHARVEIPASPGVHGMPERLGRYCILDFLGEGGMGVVYLAEQDNPRRTVALKVMRPGVLSPRLLRRFELEAQVLGRLQHPGIAQVFEAGVFESRADEHGPAGSSRAAQPFFAMEHVRGVPLTAFADGANPTGAALDHRAKLELLIKVCEAVQHAHAKGVIHRDLKPANILVVGDAASAGSGQPKVLDFGVARATDGDIAAVTLQTDVGQLVGTVPYMSPEQIAGDPNELDTRSDVYTLGVILYELLCGRLPHRLSDKTVPEAVRIIGQDDPDPPASVDRALRGDLQTIILKALERDRSRRYQSASELAADIRRFLSDEPIAARPPSRAYQLRKFASRNKGLMGGLCAAAVVLAAGVAGVAWQAVRATRGWDMAQTEADNALAVNEFLDQMLASADPENTGGREVTVREVLDLSGQSVGELLATRPRVHVSIRGTLTNTYRSIGDLDRALGHARAGYGAAAAGFGPDSKIAIEAQRVLAIALVEKGMHQEAEALNRDAVERVARVLGTHSVDYVLVNGELARVLLETGRIKESVEAWRKWFPEAERMLGSEHRETLTMMNNMAIALKDLGEYEESDDLLRRLVEIRERIHGPHHLQTLYAINSLAANIQRQGRNADAEPLFRETLERRRRILGSDHVSTIASAGNLGVTLISLGRLSEAEPLIAEALAGNRRLLGSEHAKTLIMMANRAYLLEELGQSEEAEALYRETIEVRRKATGGRDPETWAPMNNLATLYQRRGKLAEAELLFRELLDLCGQSLPPDHPYAAIFSNNYADCLTDLRRFDEAEIRLLASQVVLESKFGVDHARSVKGRARLVKLYEASGKPDLAIPYRPAGETGQRDSAGR